MAARSAMLGSTPPKIACPAMKTSRNQASNTSALSGTPLSAHNSCCWHISYIVYIYIYINICIYIYTFLKGWEISSLGQTLASASADPLTFSSTFLLMSSNLYHIQDNALGMPTDLSALLMAASCFSQVKICWNPSRYLFAPILEQLRPHLQRRLQGIRGPHRGPDNRVGQNPWFREGKENNAAILDQCSLEPKLAFVLPY